VGAAMAKGRLLVRAGRAYVGFLVISFWGSVRVRRCIRVGALPVKTAGVSSAADSDRLVCVNVGGILGDFPKRFCPSKWSYLGGDALVVLGVVRDLTVMKRVHPAYFWRISLDGRS
jgi:hypothetical protein